MPFFSKRITEPKETQIIAKNLTLDELLKEDVLKELRQKFSDNIEIIPSSLRFQIVPKQRTQVMTQSEKKAKDGKSIQITIGPADFVSLEHPSPAHFEQKIIVITSNRNATLKKFLE